MSSGCYVGLMSGTSLDGVDAVVVTFSRRRPRVLTAAHRPFNAALRGELLALTIPGHDELARAARLGITLARVYAEAVAQAITESGVGAAGVRAVGCHGQTVRHHPDEGYSVQLGNAALLAELTTLPVVCDFRSADIAAGGQGAPLAPAFHAAAFGARRENRAVLNVGGIANVSLLHRDGTVSGFDTGPGNCLMDLWAARHLGTPYDRDGAWAGGGRVLPKFLEALLAEPYFHAPAPKSTGRELFGEAWLDARVPRGAAARDVQATLLELTARGAADAIRPFAARRVIVCGGGACNRALTGRLAQLVAPAALESSGRHGIDPQQVEAAAFAWLAMQTLEARPGNLPSVTGARGQRVLGAVYAPRE